MTEQPSSGKQHRNNIAPNAAPIHSLPEVAPQGLQPLSVDATVWQRQLTDRIRVIAWYFADRARLNVVSPVAALFAYLGRRAPMSDRMRIRLLMTSQRLAPSEKTTAWLKKAIGQSKLDWRPMMPDNIDLRGAAGRSIILRPPRMRNGQFVRGVLLVKFTETLRFYAHHVDMERLQRYFRLIVEPSWTGFALPELLFLSSCPNSVIVQTSEPTDRDFLEQLGSNHWPIELGSGEWVDESTFKDLGESSRPYGAVYVANYNPIKRVPEYLKVVAACRRAAPEFRAALICSAWGRSKETVLAHIRRYGLEKSVDLFEGLSQPQVNYILNRSKANVLLSRKEGSNRSLFEGMFSGTPAVLTSRNRGVNRSRLVPESGVTCPENQMASVLLEIWRNDRSFRPAAWARKTISAEASTRALEQALETLFPDDFTGNGKLLVKVNSPEATYANPELQRLQAQLAIKVLQPLMKEEDDPGKSAMAHMSAILDEYSN